MPPAYPRQPACRRLTALKPSPLGEGVTSASEANRVTNEGSSNDESFSIDRPLTTAFGGASPKGEALIGHPCHFEQSREIPLIRNDNKRTRTPQTFARTGSAPYTNNYKKLPSVAAAFVPLPRDSHGRFTPSE